MKIGAAKRPFRVGGVAKVGDPTPLNGHSAREGPQKLKIGAPKRLFRLGGVAQVGDPTPRNGNSAREGSQNLYEPVRKQGVWWAHNMDH